MAHNSNHSEIPTCMLTTRALLTPSHGDRACDGSRLVETCLDKITDIENFPPKLLVLLVTVGFRPFEELLRGIQDTLRARGLEVPLVGCSVAGIATEEDIVEDGAVLMCLASRFLTVKIGYATGERKLHREAVRSLLKQVDLIGDNDEFIPNPDGDKLLLCFLPGHYETGRGTRCDAPAIHAAIREEIQASIPMVGGVAADNYERRRGWTFADGRVVSDGPVVALIRSDLRFGVGLSRGLQETGALFRVLETSGDGRQVLKFEGVVDGSRKVVSPGEIIERYSDGGRNAVLFGNPKPEEGDRSVQIPREQDDGTVRLPQPIDRDTILEVLTTTSAQMLDARDESLHKSATKGRIDPYHIAGILTFACASRLEFARSQNVTTEEIVTGMRTKRPGVQFVGGFVYGEIGLDPLGRSVYRRWTFSAVTFGDMLTQRALHKKVQFALAQAVRRTAMDESEKEILSTALDAIVDAGFPGGMITLVYRNLDRKVLKAKGARGRYWQAIVDQTIRWWDEDDILATVARSGKAEFIRDSREDPRCNTAAVDTAQLISQYVVALTRENDEVIGTLQVDLGDMSNRQELSPELTELLDAFGHQISAILSHSFRLCELVLRDLFDRALAASTTADTIEEAAQRFIDEAVKESNMLGTDMVHIRLARDHATVLELVAGSGAYYDAALRERRVVPLFPSSTTAKGTAEVPSARSFRRRRSEAVNLGATDDVTQAFLSSLRDGPLHEALGDEGAHISCLIRGGAQSEPIGVVSFISKEPWVFSESCWRSMSGLDKRLFVALKHAEEVELQRSAADKLKTQSAILFQITHDVRTLLMEVSGDVRTIVDLAEEGTELAKCAARVEGMAEDRASRIDKQLSDIFDGVWSTISGHELNVLLQEAVDRAKQKAIDRQLEIDFQGTAPIGVRVMEPQFVTALHYLIDNGLNAMKPDGTLTVRVEPHWDEQKVGVTIADNGRGIAEDLLRDIKAGRPLPQDPDGRPHLGLYAATEIIKQCKGTLNVTSEIGRGTTVSVVLPCTEGSTCEEEKDA